MGNDDEVVGRRDGRGEDDHQRGSAIALVGLIGALVIVAVLLLAGLTERVLDRAHAQAAADAAALAGVADGRPAAEAVARANDVVVTSFDLADNEVTVEVTTADGMRAIATAERRLEPFD